VQNLITEHLDTWTQAIETKSSAGRGSSNKFTLVGIKKLRELILEMAVRGLLVPQDTNDEPASILLEKIAAEKAQLIKQGKIKKTKSLPEISEDEKPFDLPNGWELARLNGIGDWGAGATPKRGNTEYYNGSIPWFKSGELSSDFISKTEETITEKALKECSLRLNQPGDVLIAMYGATIGKTSILEVQGTTNQAVCACTTFSGVFNQFLLLLLKAYKARFTGMGAGGAQPNISKIKIVGTVIALPPIEEQKRIVVKVDELMALCDRLEQQTLNSIEVHQTLVETLLNELVNPNNTTNIDQAWSLIAENFDVLFTTEKSIDTLKQTILQLAVMGKLVPQNPNEEPASELLKKIATEKAQLIADKKIKKTKPQPEAAIEPSFVIPESWSWTRLVDISYLITDGAHHTPKYIESGVPFLSVKDMSSGAISFDDTRFISEEQHAELSKRCNPKRGDLLLTKVGTTGIPILINTDTQFSLFVSVALIKFFSAEVLGEYLVYLIKSPFVNAQTKAGTQGVGNKNLVLKTISTLILALPPYEEQKRIVTKVNELMTLCDQLKTQLKTAQQTQTHLAQSIAQEALG